MLKTDKRIMDIEKIDNTNKSKFIKKEMQEYSILTCMRIIKYIT